LFHKSFCFRLLFGLKTIPIVTWAGPRTEGLCEPRQVWKEAAAAKYFRVANQSSSGGIFFYQSLVIKPFILSCLKMSFFNTSASFFVATGPTQTAYKPDFKDTLALL